MENQQHKYIAAWDEFTHTGAERRRINQQRAVELHAPIKAVFLTIDNHWVTYDELTSEENKQRLLKVYNKMFKSSTLGEEVTDDPFKD